MTDRFTAFDEHINLRRRIEWWWYCTTFRFHRHEYCQPGCSPVAHCWRCYATMPQTADWDAYWIDDNGIVRHKTDAVTADCIEAHNSEPSNQHSAIQNEEAK